MTLYRGVCRVVICYIHETQSDGVKNISIAAQLVFLAWLELNSCKLVAASC